MPKPPIANNPATALLIPRRNRLYPRIMPAKENKTEYEVLIAKPMTMQTVVAMTTAAIPSFEFSPTERAAIHAMTDLGFDRFNSNPRKNHLGELEAIDASGFSSSERIAERPDKNANQRRYIPLNILRTVNRYSELCRTAPMPLAATTPQNIRPKDKPKP